MRIYDFGTHECVDRTYLVMELLSYVSEHPQVKADPDWRDMAEKAHGALWVLYQSLGSFDAVPEHLPAPDYPGYSQAALKEEGQ